MLHHWTIEKKCQCRPNPRFLCPGKAIHDGKSSSSSNEIQSLSRGIFFLVNFIHSDPGFAWSLKYSFGSALSISIPLRIKSVINIRLIKCANRTQYGKSKNTKMILSLILWDNNIQNKCSQTWLSNRHCNKKRGIIHTFSYEDHIYGLENNFGIGS